VAGAFDLDPVKSKEMGKNLARNPKRVYSDYKEMIKAESALPVGDRVDFVAVTTPNNWHFPIARDFLLAGFHVMCEKPMTLTSDEGKELQKIVKEKKLVFGLMHNYTGYPMAKLARDMVKKGDLGKIRKIVVQYPQGWLATALEKTGQMQASWRTDPKQSGAGGCVGDIGTHAANLAEYISGLKITHICAELTSFVPGRPLDDDCNCLLKFDNGAKGVLHATQIGIGEENNLAIWVHGEKASLEWHQEHPNYLYVREIDKPEQVWKRGNGYVGAYSAAAGRGTRIPSGHPEAFIEAFANNYMNFAETVKCAIAGETPSELALDFPSVEAGVRGLLFIETVVASSKSDKKWTPMKQ
jgi:predicted dehydrogenase